ncbi:MAG: hypothetical protein KF861_03340 [Planctomycetaceae bacterium]|nr:hypothetical protein [Planctomycetaceae bacterium]
MKQRGMHRNTRDAHNLMKRDGSLRFAVRAVITVFVVVLMMYGHRYRANQAAIRQFCELTGLPFPENAIVVSTADDHGGFNPDGEFHIVMIVSPETLAEYRKGRPFGSTWSPGPVLEELRIHPKFGAAGDREENEVNWLLESMNVQYCAQGRPGLDGSVHWWNGMIVLVHPSTNKVWFSKWDS